MKFKLNCSPHLKMQEITKKLFNCKFLSDIQFSIGDQIIYAHSLELMKRSEVFEDQFAETWGTKQLIPISDCTYDSFLEFVRFIYTDECTINDRNGIELLKLAIKYKVIILESRVINLLTTQDWCVQLFGHCVTEKYEIARYTSSFIFSWNINSFLNGEKFVSLHPDAINTVLQLEQVKSLTEIQIFNALAKWIDTYCKQHQMSLAEGREKFDDLIQSVRFPTMSTDELRDCVKNYPALLSETECMPIVKHVLFGSDNGNDVWISKPRSDYVHTWEWRKFSRATKFETKITVSNDMILHGLWLGIEENRKEIEIEITATNMDTNESETIQFTQPAPGYWEHMLISFGDSIRVKPNFEYTIVIKYLGVIDENLNIWCRKENAQLIYNNLENSIQTLNASGNMLEMIFKSGPE